MSVRVAALAGVIGVLAAPHAPVVMAPQRYAVPAATITPVPMGASCLAEAAAEVDAGAAWLLIREAPTAKAAFERAVDRDPDCALGYWGQALANVDRARVEAPDDGTVAATALGRAIEAAIGRALAVPARTPFEVATVAALRAMRDRVAAPGVPAAWPARVAAYRDALCAGAASDRRIRLWCARALADAAGPYAPGPASEALAHVVELGRDRPLDVGLALIVLDVAADRQSPIVTRALEAIAAADPPAPWPHLAAADAAAARGDWTRAATSSARAAAVTNDPSARDRALDAELAALMQLGRRRDAYARAGGAVRLPADAPDDARELAARAFARLVIADRRIDGRGLGDRAALGLGAAETRRWPAVFVDALDAALRAWPGGDAPQLSRARASLETLKALAGEDSSPNEVDWAATIVEAAIAASQDEHQQMALFLTHAAEMEASPSTFWLGHDRLVPSREIAAELWLRTYRYDDARREARAVLKEHPGRVAPYVVLGRTAGRVQDAVGAAEAWKKVLELRAAADADDSIRLEAQQALARQP